MCDPDTCHQSSRCAETIPPDADKRVTVPCVCDTDLPRLEALMATGIEQPEASRMLWRRASGTETALSRANRSQAGSYANGTLNGAQIEDSEGAA